ncbi:MAG: methyltransferase domain-containing protein [Pyrinomonadaceae bacterium]|nr:methyltransferase domain-containing protein [Pyrinomonadaceae bacterium]
MKDAETAVSAVRGELSLALCESCGFIFNQAFDLSKLSYGEDYDNTQSCSTLFDEYLNDLVRHLVVERDVQNCRIVEVGCGKGSFLRKLVEREGAGNRGYGFDPSYIGPEQEYEGRLRFVRRYYGPECADIPADVVICRHVIEHVPEPLNLLRAVKQALVHSPNSRVFFETPCVEWILRNRVVWDFFYEHCSYFTTESLTTAFETAGFRVEGVRHVFGGQYLWLEARTSTDKLVISKRPGSIPQLAEEFTARENELKRRWAMKIQKLAANGRVALWGAGAKGVTLANLVDAERRWITCVVDINPQKQGRYIPGTGHPIVHFRELPSRGVNVAVLMNPNYRHENLALLREADLSINLVDLTEDEYQANH